MRCRGALRRRMSPQDRPPGRVTLMDTILVVNAGSSSVKFQVFAIGDANALTRLIKGQIDGIGSKPRLIAEDSSKVRRRNLEFSRDQVPAVPEAIVEAGKWLR